MERPEHRSGVGATLVRMPEPSRDETTCVLLRALIDIDAGDTVEEALAEAWDAVRDETALPYNQVVTDLGSRGLLAAHVQIVRGAEIGNDKPLISEDLVVDGITAAGRQYVADHCRPPDS